MSLYYRKYALCNLRNSIPTDLILCVIRVLIRVALRVYWYLQDSLSTGWILVVLFLKHFLVFIFLFLLPVNLLVLFIIEVAF